MKTAKEKKLFWIVAVVIAIVTFVVSYTGVLYSFDKIFSDKLYQAPSGTNPQIKIVGIDEKTLAEYGDVTEWSRSITADFINKLTADPTYAPSAIGLDILYISDGDEEGDELFAKACENSANIGVKIVTASNLVYRPTGKINPDGSFVVDENNIAMVEIPYEGLAAVTDYAFANTSQDVDGYIRYAIARANYNGQEINSFPVQIYKNYCEKNGLAFAYPKTYGNEIFGFAFSGKSTAYEKVSLSDVLNGNIDPKAFAGSIVLLGSYAPGMQDAYNVAVQKGNQMYGVEIHANIIDALMKGKTNEPVNPLIFAIIITILALVFYAICDKVKILPSTILLIAFIIVDLICGKLMFMKGIVINLIVLPIILILIYAYLLITGYMVEWIKHRKTVEACNKYVAAQVVGEVSKKGEFNIVLGGEKRGIAVLFVDIRGFTPMSEGLQPEQVVEILNEYLSLTTHSIFKNNGTLDKFVGDATMAVFNAPFDLDDYVYRAVCTARDIAAGSEELEKKLMERFGKTVSFGIGVNCGDAVVGNIGCDFRMDYTAIGDTVNTAARLEANAKRGQILISDNVYNRLKDRVKVTEIGAIPLKGKSNEVIVYQVDEVL